MFVLQSSPLFYLSNLETTHLTHRETCTKSHICLEKYIQEWLQCFISIFLLDNWLINNESIGIPLSSIIWYFICLFIKYWEKQLWKYFLTILHKVEYVDLVFHIFSILIISLYIHIIHTLTHRDTHSFRYTHTLNIKY